MLNTYKNVYALKKDDVFVLLKATVHHLQILLRLLPN